MCLVPLMSTQYFIRDKTVTKKYGDLADHTKILKRLQKLIDLMEEQNDILLYDDECCCPGCDGDCGCGEED